MHVDGRCPSHLLTCHSKEQKRSSITTQIAERNCYSAYTLMSYVTLHHEMSRNAPDGHFHVFFKFSESKKHFKIRGLVAELHVFEYGGTTFGTFEKTCFEC